MPELLARHRVAARERAGAHEHPRPVGGDDDRGAGHRDPADVVRVEQVPTRDGAQLPGAVGHFDDRGEGAGGRYAGEPVIAGPRADHQLSAIWIQPGARISRLPELRPLVEARVVPLFIDPEDVEVDRGVIGDDQYSLVTPGGGSQATVEGLSVCAVQLHGLSPTRNSGSTHTACRRRRPISGRRARPAGGAAPRSDRRSARRWSNAGGSGGHSRPGRTGIA